MQKGKQTYAKKGSAIKRAGYSSAVAMLPTKVKKELDNLLLDRKPVLEIITQLSSRFPGVNIPSKSAIYNYRKKNFPKSLVSSTQIQKANEELDLDKIELKSVLVRQVKQFIAVDLPRLRNNLYSSLDAENDPNVIKGRKDALRAYIDGMRVAMDAIPKFNITIEEEKSSSEVERAEAALGKNIDDVIEKILQREVRKPYLK